MTTRCEVCIARQHGAVDRLVLGRCIVRPTRRGTNAEIHVAVEAIE